MDCALQIGHLCFRKRVLGVKGTKCNWSVSCECRQELLQLYWLGSAAMFYNSMLVCNSELVRKVLSADQALRNMPGVHCWTAEILAAFNGLHRSEQFTQAVRNGAAILMNS